MSTEGQTDAQSIQRARYEFKRALENLRKYKGSGTELVSVYVTPERNMGDVTTQLRGELGQAQNIKSKSTRKNVSSALESIIHKIKNFKVPPENGMVLLAGEVLIGNNKTKSISEMIVPPDKVPINTYRCDSRFFLEPLEGMLEEQNIYGLLVIDRSEATFGFLRGQRIDIIKNFQSHVPRKHRKGGQSQARMARNIELEADAFFRSTVDAASEAWRSEENLKGILLGGPGSTKDYVLSVDNWWDHELKPKVIQTFDTGYTDEYGLTELVQNAHDVLEQIGLTHEKDLIQKFFGELRKDRPLAAYGEEEVRQMLDLSAVSMLLLAESLRKWRIHPTCPNGHAAKDITVTDVEDLDAHPPKCPECSADYDWDEPLDVVQGLSELAEDTGAQVEFITKESKEGEMFTNAFGGIAALLRFRP